MPATGYLLSAFVAVVAGLDRTAALQIMISRPIIAAPLTGWLLGEPMIGLQVGGLIELLWLGRLPVGAAIPPDDTQVAVAATALTVIMGERLALYGFPFLLLCTLVALPLGKIGQLIDRLVRNRNLRLIVGAEAALEMGDLAGAERCHLRGLAHFALASLISFAVIFSAGSLVLHFLAPLLIEPVAAAAGRIGLALPLIGAATVVGTINIARARILLVASFVTVLLILWLVR